MSRTTEQIGMLAGGIAIAMLAGPIGIGLFHSLVIMNDMVGIGLTTAVIATAGLLNPAPLDPSNIGPEGQLPVNSPNPLWRVVYGIFQFGGSITFLDGPILDWQGTGAGTICENQYVHRVHTLTCHQIAGFLAVVIDGQTFNFGTDLTLLTTANNGDGKIGPPGIWAFNSNSNPWAGQIYFAFDCGDPGNSAPPFTYLLAGATAAGVRIPIGSTRWPATALQRGRAKVHVLLHYVPSSNQNEFGPIGGAPQPYVLGTGRMPTIEFKIAGRIILDYRVVTAWQPNATYQHYAYVLVNFGGYDQLFVQTAGGFGAATSGATVPNFLAVGIGLTVTDDTCVWLNCGTPIYAAGSGRTGLNFPTSIKLGGPGGATLVADAWVGTSPALMNQVIEAPIGVLQMALSNFTSGANRPNFLPNGAPTSFVPGTVTPESSGPGQWVCLGRSKYATCLPDNDGTQNQGGFSNPALVTADYLQTPRNQFGLGAPLTLDSIDTIVAAANICDEAVVIEIFPHP